MLDVLHEQPIKGLKPSMERQVGFATNHADFIQDLAFDFYGERIATCSSDHSIKIWRRNDAGHWMETGAITGHVGTFHKLDWAHPEFGRILAACSSDHNVIVYEEINESQTSKQTWIERARLVDITSDVNDVKFAPRHLGLRLAVCGDDGIVRIFEAINVLELSGWPLLNEIQASKSRCNCISWNKSQFDSPQIVVGTDDSLQVWQYYSEYRRWNILVTLQPCGYPVLTVDWAPNLGRTFHLIAAGSKDGHVRIFEVFEDKARSDSLECSIVADRDDHACEVWGVSWNLSGTVLASSGDNGTVLVWKRGFDNQWFCDDDLKQTH